MHGVAAHFAEPPDGRLAGTHGGGSASPALFRRWLSVLEFDHGAEAFDRTRPQFKRSRVLDELAALLVVGVGEQCLDRHRLEFRIAIEFLTVRKGELRCFDYRMDEFRTRDIEAVEVKALEQGKLLQHHRALRPWSRFADGVPAILVHKRPFDGGLPAD